MVETLSGQAFRAILPLLIDKLRALFIYYATELQLLRTYSQNKNSVQFESHEIQTARLSFEHARKQLHAALI